MDINITRFHEKYEKGLKDECWEWQAARTQEGYGLFCLYDEDGEKKWKTAHRISYCLSNDVDIFELSSLEHVCHSCDNPPCVNPEHLWLDSIKGNMVDASKKRRLSGPPKRRIKSVRRKYIRGWSKKKLAKYYGVDVSYVRNIIDGRMYAYAPMSKNIRLRIDARIRKNRRKNARRNRWRNKH